jgi:hypothetical protein
MKFVPKVIENGPLTGLVEVPLINIGTADKPVLVAPEGFSLEQRNGETYLVSIEPPK